MGEMRPMELPLMLGGRGGGLAGCLLLVLVLVMVPEEGCVGLSAMRHQWTATPSPTRPTRLLARI